MRPLAVMLLTAVGGVLGFVGFRELRRRRRRRPQHSSAQESADSALSTELRHESGPRVVSVQQTTTHLVLRRPQMPENLSLIRILFEFLIFVISILLAWIVSPGDQQFLVLIHMAMIWMSLRSVGVSLPSASELEDSNTDSTAIYEPPSLPSSNDDPDVDGDSASRNPVLFLGRPPPSSSASYHWIGPVSATFKVDVCSAVRNYWTFFGSEHMPKLIAELLDSKASLSGEHLIHRAVRLQLNPPYFIRSALGGVSDVDIRERSVWNPRDQTFHVHSCNISSRKYVTIMDICVIQRDQLNPDWTCMTRQVCYQVSDSVGMLRSSLQALIKTLIHKKAQEFIVKFEIHLHDSKPSSDPNNVLDLIGQPSLTL